MRYCRHILPSLALLFSIFASSRAFASNNPAYYRKLESSFLEVIDSSVATKGDYPWWAKAMQSNLLKFDPSGSSSLVPESCDPDQLKLTAKGSLVEIKDYFGRCEGELGTYFRDIVTNTYLTVFLKLSPEKHPYAQHVFLKLPGGVKVKGLLALKEDGLKRPLVLIRLGIFSNTSEFFPERSLFMKLFEQSPFNVLLLESLSGSEYIENNDRFALGGFEEGVQNFWIARQLQNPKEPIFQLIDSVHLSGMSMGGHGTFFAAIMNELNEKPISSFMAFCPLVNFTETFNFLQQQKYTMKGMNFWASKRLSKLHTLYPNLTQSRFIADVFDALKAQDVSWYPEYQGLRWPRNMINENFTERLSFWQEYKNISTPFLIFATKTDPIVSFALNSEKILRKEIDVGSSQMEVIPLERGYHCSIPAAYNWKAMTTIFQKYIRVHSGTWEPQIDKYEIRYEAKPGVPIEWDVSEDGVFLTSGSWGSYQKIQFPIDLIKTYKLSRPLSEEDQSLVRRWLYQNVKVNRVIPPKDQDGITKTELIWEY